MAGNLNVLGKIKQVEVLSAPESVFSYILMIVNWKLNLLPLCSLQLLNFCGKHRVTTLRPTDCIIIIITNILTG